MSTPTEQPTVLWEPSEELVERATITRFASWVAETRGVDVAGDYHALWRWSVEDVEGFWAAIWEFFDVQSETRLRAGARVARDAGRRVVPRRDGQLRRATSSAGATTATSRSATPRSCASSASGRGATCAGRPREFAAGLRALGVERGDRVVAYIPNIPEAVAGLLACASHRRDLVVVLAGLRRAQRRRPLRADRAEGAHRRRRLPLRRQGLRPARHRRAAAGRDGLAREDGGPAVPRLRRRTSTGCRTR